MRIAQIAPPWFPVPPVGYGGIERVVYDLTEGLIGAGCEVILCAPPGSRSVVPTAPRRLAPHEGLSQARPKGARIWWPS